MTFILDMSRTDSSRFYVGHVRTRLKFMVSVLSVLCLSLALVTDTWTLLSAIKEFDLIWFENVFGKQLLIYSFYFRFVFRPRLATSAVADLIFPHVTLTFDLDLQLDLYSVKMNQLTIYVDQK